jgi:hypothetical protein
MNKKRMSIYAAAVATIVAAAGGAWLVYLAYHEPGADRTYQTSVASPALHLSRPRVIFDEGHNNLHSSLGRFRPFADLIRSDGCSVSALSGQVTEKALAFADVLVIVNARGPDSNRAAAAFTDAECSAILRWVDEGGSLLLVADHYPFGEAAADLASRFGVHMSGGWTIDASADEGVREDGRIRFGSDRLGDHVIIAGFRANEAVAFVDTFTGQSLAAPEGAVPLLVLSEQAIDNIPTNATVAVEGSRQITTFDTQEQSASGRCQGLAMDYGKGRVVVLAEAAMISAQIGKDRQPFGMNVEGNDNRQFVLNTMRWLARLK